MASGPSRKEKVEKGEEKEKVEKGEEKEKEKKKVFPLPRK